MHVTIPKGTEITAYVNGDINQFPPLPRHRAGVTAALRPTPRARSTSQGKAAQGAATGLSASLVIGIGAAVGAGIAYGIYHLFKKRG